MKFKVPIYYESVAFYEVEAEDREEALDKAWEKWREEPQPVTQFEHHGFISYIDTDASIEFMEEIE